MGKKFPMVDSKILICKKKENLYLGGTCCGNN